MAKEESMTSRELRNCVGWEVPRDKISNFILIQRKKKKILHVLYQETCQFCARLLNIAMGNTVRSSLMGVICKYVSRL